MLAVPHGVDREKLKLPVDFTVYPSPDGRIAVRFSSRKMKINTQNGRLSFVSLLRLLDALHHTIVYRHDFTSLGPADRSGR